MASSTPPALSSLSGCVGCRVVWCSLESPLLPSVRLHGLQSCVMVPPLDDGQHSSSSLKNLEPMCWFSWFSPLLFAAHRLLCKGYSWFSASSHHYCSSPLMQGLLLVFRLFSAKNCSSWLLPHMQRLPSPLILNGERLLLASYARAALGLEALVSVFW